MLIVALPFGSGWRVMNVLALFGLLLASSSAFGQSPGSQQPIQGKARIIDGDTLEIGIDRFDLYGIDAPEEDQTCERGGAQWRCGLEATFAMAALLETHWISCRRRGVDAGGNLTADCRIGGPKGISVNEEFVRRGWALVRPPSAGEFAAAEREAKAAQVGLWSGTFVAPWEWRRMKGTGTAAN